MRVGLVLLAALAIPGCTFNFVKPSGETERLKQRIDYFKWLYQKGFYRSDPEMMKKAATRLLEPDIREREELPSRTEALERLVRRLEDEIDRLAKERR
jgi:hypothetical protein